MPDTDRLHFLRAIDPFALCRCGHCNRRRGFSRGRTTGKRTHHKDRRVAKAKARREWRREAQQEVCDA